MSAPNAFKHYQFQEKQAQLSHENQNAASLSAFVTALPEIMKEAVKWCKIFNFLIKTSGKKRSKQASLFETLSTVLFCHFTAMSVYSRSHEDSSALDVLELIKEELKQNSCLFLC